MLQILGPQGNPLHNFVLSRNIVEQLKKLQSTGSRNLPRKSPTRPTQQATTPRVSNNRVVLNQNRSPHIGRTAGADRRLSARQRLTQYQRLMELMQRRNAINRARRINNNQRFNNGIRISNAYYTPQRSIVPRHIDRYSRNGQPKSFQYRTNTMQNAPIQNMQRTNRMQQLARLHSMLAAQRRNSQPTRRGMSPAIGSRNRSERRFKSPMQSSSNQRPNVFKNKIINVNVHYDVVPHNKQSRRLPASKINKYSPANPPHKTDPSVKVNQTASNIKFYEQIQNQIYSFLDKLYFSEYNTSTVNQSETMVTDQMAKGGQVTHSRGNAVDNKHAVSKGKSHANKQVIDIKTLVDTKHSKTQNRASNSVKTSTIKKTKVNRDRKKQAMKKKKTVAGSLPVKATTTRAPGLNNTTEFVFDYPGSNSVKVRVDKGTKVSNVKNPDGSSKLVIIQNVVTTEEPVEVEAP